METIARKRAKERLERMEYRRWEQEQFGKTGRHLFFVTLLIIIAGTIAWGAHELVYGTMDVFKIPFMVVFVLIATLPFCSMYLGARMEELRWWWKKHVMDYGNED